LDLGAFEKFNYLHFEGCNMAKSNKPNGTKTTKTPEVDAPALVPPDAAPVARSAQFRSLPANIVTGYIMYVNSHYYYSLDCCVTGDQHTSVLVTTTAQTIYTCDDPDRVPIVPSGSIEENFVASDYSFACINPSITSRVTELISGPGTSSVRRATVVIAPRTADDSDVPPQFLGKVYGLFEVKFDGRTYAFLVYEQPATRLELEAQFLSVPRMDDAIFMGDLSVGRARYVVRGVIHS
jgi:hypothetical protein